MAIKQKAKKYVGPNKPLTASPYVGGLAASIGAFASTLADNQTAKGASKKGPLDDLIGNKLVSDAKNKQSQLGGNKEVLEKKGKAFTQHLTSIEDMEKEYPDLTPAERNRIHTQAKLRLGTIDLKKFSSSFVKERMKSFKPVFEVTGKNVKATGNLYGRLKREGILKDITPDVIEENRRDVEVKHFTDLANAERDVNNKPITRNMKVRAINASNMSDTDKEKLRAVVDANEIRGFNSNNLIAEERFRQLALNHYNENNKSSIQRSRSPELNKKRGQIAGQERFKEGLIKMEDGENSHALSIALPNLTPGMAAAPFEAANRIQLKAVTRRMFDSIVSPPPLIESANEGAIQQSHEITNPQYRKFLFDTYDKLTKEGKGWGDLGSPTAKREVVEGRLGGFTVKLDAKGDLYSGLKAIGYSDEEIYRGLFSSVKTATGWDHGANSSFAVDVHSRSGVGLWRELNKGQVAALKGIYTKKSKETKEEKGNWDKLVDWSVEQLDWLVDLPSEILSEKEDKK